MPELILPVIPLGATRITGLVSVYRTEEMWTYFWTVYPIYSHGSKDHRMFRFIIAQLIQAGACRQVDILKTFGISKSCVDRAMRQLREEGAESFFTERKRRKGGTVLTKELLEKAQEFLDKGYSRKNTAKELKVKVDTLRKAINSGRLNEPKPSKIVTDKSTRSEVDAEAANGMGTACTRVDERFLASLGKLGEASVKFEPCKDVPNGGVLCALPSLLSNGLLEGAERLLGKVKGYYNVFHVLIFLAFIALCRIKTLEKVRGKAPGEFGKLLGLDRAPEVRCLRKKMDELNVGEATEKWAAHLTQHWMNSDPDSAGTLYVDGHVRVYHGSKTKLPRRFVSRERLCLRGTTDYWVNDALGKPFFVIEKPIDPGLLQTLEKNIVPRLLKDIPDQPLDEELKLNPQLCRFVMVFDREGYSPGFFKKMWKQHRIACMTYHKFPDNDWAVESFMSNQVRMPNGETVTMLLAERGSLIDSGKDVIWVREVRKLNDSGHQTSLISTAYELPHIELAAKMFSRWCQENFFQYMMQHFEIDLLMDYGTEDFPATEIVVNPAWRRLDRLRNSLQNKLRYRNSRFAALTLHPESENDPKKYKKWIDTKGELLELIQNFEHELEGIKKKIKKTPKHITWEELSEEDKFQRLIPGRKRLMDTVRMIAYISETAMVSLLKSTTVDSPAARRLLQDLFVTEADILPNMKEGLLVVRIHSASRPAASRSLLKLIEQLNNTETLYPGTELRLVYELLGTPVQATSKVSNGVSESS